MGTIGKVTAGGATHLIASTAYATCSTAAATAAKVATIQDSQAFTLLTGTTVHVKFTYSNSVANPTLNVNSTGAKSIYKYGTTAPGTTAATSWQAGSVIAFTYDGSSWQMNDHLDDTNSNNAVTQTEITPTGTSTYEWRELLCSESIADYTTKTESAAKSQNLVYSNSTNYDFLRLTAKENKVSSIGVMTKSGSTSGFASFQIGSRNGATLNTAYGLNNGSPLFSLDINYAGPNFNQYENILKIDPTAITMSFGDILSKALIDLIYPIGSIYISVDSTDPGDMWTGTEWIRFGIGRTLVGVNEENAKFETPELTGGEETHTLTVNEIPSHTHGITTHSTTVTSASSYVKGAKNSAEAYTYTGSTGGNQAHNNMPPYITTYMWKRTA